MRRCCEQTVTSVPLAARQDFAALEPEYQRMLERNADGVIAYRRVAFERPPLNI
ncbi:MAG: hypothetical protein WBG92_04985 [Thiohalocapsa sp.]